MVSPDTLDERQFGSLKYRQSHIVQFEIVCIAERVQKPASFVPIDLLCINLAQPNVLSFFSNHFAKYCPTTVFQKVKHCPK